MGDAMTINEAIKGRLTRIREKMRNEGFDALLITSKQSVTFITGFTGDDSWAIVGKKDVLLITDGRYNEQAQKQCHCTLISRNCPMIKQIAAILNRRNSIKIIATEPTIQTAVFNALKDVLNCRIKADDKIIENVRQCKDDYETGCIKKAASIADNVLKRVLLQIKVGISESEFAGLVEFEIRKANVKAAFDTIAAFGANASCPHYAPGARKLRKRDTILLDYGVEYNGYCCDITRCFIIGKPDKEYVNAYNTVAQAQRQAIKAVKAGAKMCDVDAAARQVIKDAGLPDFSHSTGHGLGLNVHEMPTIHKTNKTALQCGNVITIEPGVYIPGKLGIRIEDDVLVTKNGCEILTKKRGIPPFFD